MARIIENMDGKRRTIKLSSDDIISIVREYQRIVHDKLSSSDIYNILRDNVIFIPEEY